MPSRVPFKITPTYAFTQAALFTGCALAGVAAVGGEVLKLVTCTPFSVNAADAAFIGIAALAFAAAHNVVTEFAYDKENEKKLPAYEKDLAKWEADKKIDLAPL